MPRSILLWLLWGMLLLRVIPLAAHEAQTYFETGVRAFCAEQDAVVRVDPAGVCSNTEAGILTFNPLNQ